jgi:hypothetical protein
MDFRMFETGEIAARLPKLDEGDSTMGERNGEGTVELIDIDWVVLSCCICFLFAERIWIL